MPDDKSCMDVVGNEHRYVVPAKLVKTPKDMQLWDKSEAYFEYLGFILAINESVRGKSNSQGAIKVSSHVSKLANVIETFSNLVDETPPIQQPQRFGNQAFRTLYQKVHDTTADLLQAILPKDKYAAVPEIMGYLTESLGNSTRIDYGTGHEISFAMFLCCLFKIGYLVESDKSAVGCILFTKYLNLVRKLQKTYRMEPAGSHGVWSLDDYQFIPFIWGSSQLIGHPKLEPQSFLDENILNQYSDEYMFLGCIKYIMEVKTGPFAEHSHQLWTISGVPSWTKVNGGLIKMYKVEVLGKFPVVQHIVFGSLLPLKPADPSRHIRKAKMGICLESPAASLTDAAATQSHGADHSSSSTSANSNNIN